MPSLNDIDKEIREVHKRMLRFIETGDLKRLVRLRSQLAQLQADLEVLKEEAAKVTPARFRRSYAFEAWCEASATGRKTFLRFN